MLLSPLLLSLAVAQASLSLRESAFLARAQLLNQADVRVRDQIVRTRILQTTFKYGRLRVQETYNAADLQLSDPRPKARRTAVADHVLARTISGPVTDALINQIQAACSPRPVAVRPASTLLAELGWLIVEFDGSSPDALDDVLGRLRAMPEALREAESDEVVSLN